MIADVQETPINVGSFALTIAVQIVCSERWLGYG